MATTKISCLLPFLTETTYGKPYARFNCWEVLPRRKYAKIVAFTMVVRKKLVARFNCWAVLPRRKYAKIVAFTMDGRKKLFARFNCWAVLHQKKYLNISNGITDLLSNAFSMEQRLTQKSTRKKRQKLGVFLLERRPEYSLKLGLPSQKCCLLWNL